MLRFLLFLLLLYIAWKIVQVFVRRSRYRAEHGKPQKTTTSFEHIQDAEFEDVTNKPAEKQ